MHTCPSCKAAHTEDEWRSNAGRCLVCGTAIPTSAPFTPPLPGLDERPSGIRVNTEFDATIIESSIRSISFLFWGSFMIGPIAGFHGSEPLIALLMLVVLLPFGYMTALRLFGVVRVRIADEGEVFVGVWGLGWRRTFLWSEVVEVVEGEAGSTTNDVPDREIRIVRRNSSPIRFGTPLNDPKRRYLLAYLRNALVERGNSPL